MPNQCGTRILGNRQMDSDRTAVRDDLDAAVVTFARHHDHGEPRKTRQDGTVLRRRRNGQHFDRAHSWFVAADVPDRHQRVYREPGAPCFLDDDRGELMRASEWKRIVGQRKFRSYFSTRGDRLASMLTSPLRRRKPRCAYPVWP